MTFNVNYFVGALGDLAKYIPLTFCLALMAMIFSIVFGIALNFFLSLNKRWLTWLIKVYTSFFRGTPLLVQLFILYFGVPEIFPEFKGVGPIIVAIIGLSLNNIAFVSEIIRGGVFSIDKTQVEAAQSLNMSSWDIFDVIVAPQVTRIILPSLINNFIGLIKGTTLTFTIGVTELMARSQEQAALSFKYLEQYLAVAMLYWLIAIVIEIFQLTYERFSSAAYIN
ncbi:amino acid ABC transporter permease [Liquorilactobacillus uvarum]|uniref:amino acid ABC transporter permease n=1 Tax=Liquorilactobacillus uvarum TaxID=303240 RepID=UPI00288A0020|nr:amino acid ABC transporter permease [Liquorilactobacillus uvarum]